MLGAPAPHLFSCVVCHIRACFHVFSVILAVFSSASASLDLIKEHIKDPLDLREMEHQFSHCQVIVSDPLSIRYRPHHDDTGEIIVTSSVQKVERTAFASNPVRKYLTDCLAVVLLEEQQKILSGEEDSLSIYGNNALCVQELGSKMREECAFGGCKYLGADLMQEALNTKQFFIKMPPF